MSSLLSEPSSQRGDVLVTQAFLVTDKFGKKATAPAAKAVIPIPKTEEPIPAQVSKIPQDIKKTSAGVNPIKLILA